MLLWSPHSSLPQAGRQSRWSCFYEHSIPFLQTPFLLCSCLGGGKKKTVSVVSLFFFFSLKSACAGVQSRTADKLAMWGLFPPMPVTLISITARAVCVQSSDNEQRIHWGAHDVQLDLGKIHWAPALPSQIGTRVHLALWWWEGEPPTNKGPETGVIGHYTANLNRANSGIVDFAYPPDKVILHSIWMLGTYNPCTKNCM